MKPETTGEEITGYTPPQKPQCGEGHRTSFMAYLVALTTAETKLSANVRVYNGTLTCMLCLLSLCLPTVCWCDINFNDALLLCPCLLALCRRTLEFFGAQNFAGS